jgi:hypothetical protein
MGLPRVHFKPMIRKLPWCILFYIEIERLMMDLIWYWDRKIPWCTLFDIEIKKIPWCTLFDIEIEKSLNVPYFILR